MRIAWIAHDPGYLGGAELTQAEFRQSAPSEGVEILDVRPGDAAPEVDRVVIHNCPYHTLDDLKQFEGVPMFKYLHDVWPTAVDPDARSYVLEHAQLIFCSELHQRKFPWPIPDWTRTHVIPPALDLKRFKAPRQSRRHRKGTCSIAQWRNPGKGAQAVAEWAKDNGPVDVYGPGIFVPPGLVYHDPIPPDKLPQTFWKYERFVFLPTELEPFCRTVAEAHAAGCTVVTNQLVGALEYLDRPEVLESAADEFWRVVLQAT